MTNKRILSIWDFRTVPYSMGDLITLISRLETDLIKNQVDKFDIVFFCDPEKPTRDFGDQKITTKNFHAYFGSLMSTVFISNNIGSFFIFDNLYRLHKFINDNKDDYIFMPTVESIENKEFCYRKNFNYIQCYFKEIKNLPMINCRQGTLENITLFYKQNILPKFPVVCHIRNSKSQPERNANVQEWNKFFIDAWYSNPDIVFIIIGTKEETKEFRDMTPNVIISKDYFNSIEEDMCLIYTSLFFMGTRSGPLMMALLNKIPCVIFGYVPVWEKLQENNKFNFMTDLQKLIFEKENKEMIKEEFENLYKNVNKKDWLNYINLFKNEEYNKSTIMI